MWLIDRLEPSRRVKGRILVWLEGMDQPLRVTENEVLTFALRPGETLEEETLAALKAAAGTSSAKAQAAQLLSHRPLSKKELEQRLQKKGQTTEDAAAAAQRMEELGVVNDAEYARMLVHSYDRRGYGPRRIRHQLQQHGIPVPLWEEAMEELSDPVEQVLRFLSAGRGVDCTDEKSRRRAADALLRRGFDWESIRIGLNRFGAEIEEESL